MVDPFAKQRAEMVARQIEERGLHDSRLLDVLRSVPRHDFVPEQLRSQAYDDRPLPIGSGQTISQPYIVALMTSLLHLSGSETVLEIGTGSGYQAAVLGRLAASVHTLERHANLAEHAAALLVKQELHNVVVHCGDGSLGWPDAAPYEGILVTAAAPAPPAPLLNQLSDAGRLVIPIGGHSGQMLQVWQRLGSTFETKDVIPVVFVPLRGSHGWSEDAF